jgi:hypothetical protein
MGGAAATAGAFAVATGGAFGAAGAAAFGGAAGAAGFAGAACDIGGEIGAGDGGGDGAIPHPARTVEATHSRFDRSASMTDYPPMTIEIFDHNPA